MNDQSIIMFDPVGSVQLGVAGATIIFDWQKKPTPS